MFINRPFYIESKLSSHRRIDIVGGNLVIKTKSNRKSQQFIFDYKSRTIKSMVNRGSSFDIRGAGRTTNL